MNVFNSLLVMFRLTITLTYLSFILFKIKKLLLIFLLNFSQGNILIIVNVSFLHNNLIYQYIFTYNFVCYTCVCLFSVLLTEFLDLLKLC